MAPLAGGVGAARAARRTSRTRHPNRHACDAAAAMASTLLWPSLMQQCDPIPRTGGRKKKLACSCGGKGRPSTSFSQQGADVLGQGCAFHHRQHTALFLLSSLLHSRPPSPSSVQRCGGRHGTSTLDNGWSATAVRRATRSMIGALVVAGRPVLAAVNCMASMHP